MKSLEIWLIKSIELSSKISCFDYDKFTYRRQTLNDQFILAGYSVKDYSDYSLNELDFLIRHGELNSEELCDVILWPKNFYPILNIGSSFNNLMTIYAYSSFPIKMIDGLANFTYIPSRARQGFDSGQVNVIKPKFPYFDINNFSNYIKLVHQNVESRNFNQVELINSGWFKKSSVNKSKLRAEFDFIKKRNKNDCQFYPIVRAYEENEDSASYEIEFIDSADASLLYINNLLVGAIYDIFVLNIRKYFQQQLLESTERNFKCGSFLVAKYDQRIADLKKLNIFPVIDYMSNVGSFYSNSFFDEFRSELLHVIDSNLFGLSAEIHGDLCLSNILCDEFTTFKLIDPRGGSNLYLAYDLAKLSHSILGGYDFVIHNYSKLNFDENGFSMILNNTDEKYTELIVELADYIGVEYKYVRLLEIYLFITMLPLHSESDRKVLSFMSIAISQFKKYRESVYG